MTISELVQAYEKEVIRDEFEHAEWRRKSFKTHRNRHLNDLKVFKECYKGGAILEIGSAPFNFTRLLTKLESNLQGVDLRPDKYSTLIESCQLNIISCDIENESLPFDDDTFHFIFFNEVFEHLRIDPISTLKEINRVLHPEGKMMLTTPNLYGFNSIIGLLSGKGFDDPYYEFSKLQTLGYMGHVRLYTMKQIQSFAVGTGFTKISSKMYSANEFSRLLYQPLNLIRRVFPIFHTSQIHIFGKIHLSEKSDKRI